MPDFLVCPDDDALFARIGGRSAVIRVNDVGDLRDIRKHADEHSVHIHCVACTTPTLSSFPLDAIDPDLPVALHASRLGAFPSVLPMLPALRRYNLRVYLPLSHPDRFAELRILSSLGVHTAAMFGSDAVDWERAADLMTYALLGRAPHAPIEPFHYLATRYDPQRKRDWSSVFFDDPAVYVHVDASGRLALRRGELERGPFLDLDLSQFDEMPRHPEFLERQANWKTHFLMNDPCSRCPGWRVCGGLFASQRDGGGCQTFFTEFLDCIEQAQVTAHPRLGREDIWQP